MPSYWQLLLLVLPVFAVVRRVHWIEGEAETSLIRLVVNLCSPCLIFESVAGNAALPAALVSVIIARLYGGNPRTAVQIVLGTTAPGVLVIPLWLKVGLAWVGV